MPESHGVDLVTHSIIKDKKTAVSAVSYIRTYRPPTIMHSGKAEIERSDKFPLNRSL